MRSYGITAIALAGWPTDLITAPTTRDPFFVVSGTDPGAEILARALRTCCRHCRRSKAAAEPGERPPLPAASRPAGIAAGAITAAAAGMSPAAPCCHIAIQAR